jgi:prolyl oligopeptidase
LLQWATEGDERQGERLILQRQESEAGHGAGKPLGKRVEEAADEMRFFAWQLEVPLT